MACGFAWVMTNRNGLPAPLTSATVSETDHRSAGEGQTGIKTRSARLIIAALCSEMVGAVSMKQCDAPRLARFTRPVESELRAFRRAAACRSPGAHAIGSRYPARRYLSARRGRRPRARLQRQEGWPAWFFRCRPSGN